MSSIPSNRPVRLAVPKAVVTLTAGHTPSEELARDIQSFIHTSMPEWKTRYPGVEALEQVHALLPDLVILDVQMHGRNGLRTAAEIDVEPGELPGHVEAEGADLDGTDAARP